MAKKNGAAGSRLTNRRLSRNIVKWRTGALLRRSSARHVCMRRAVPRKFQGHRLRRCGADGARRRTLVVVAQTQTFEVVQTLEGPHHADVTARFGPRAGSDPRSPPRPGPRRHLLRIARRVRRRGRKRRRVGPGVVGRARRPRLAVDERVSPPPKPVRSWTRRSRPVRVGEAVGRRRRMRRERARAPGGPRSGRSPLMQALRGRKGGRSVACSTLRIFGALGATRAGRGLRTLLVARATLAAPARRETPSPAPVARLAERELARARR